MGRAVIDIIGHDADLELSAAWVREGDERSGEPVASWHPAAADSAAVTSSDLVRVLDGADVAVDFSLPVATSAIAGAAQAAGVALVCGVTGLGDDQHASLRAASAKIPLVYDRNMSVGIQVLNHLLSEAAERLGTDYDAEIIEAHHRAKRDAPSGTAILLGETVAAARGQDFAAEAVYARHGESGPRRTGSIGFSAIRAGAIVGEHSVLLVSPHEELRLAHRAETRTVFAAGALRAARWASGRKPGLYSMADVLSLG